MPRPDDHTDARGRDDGTGTLWFTIAQAAVFLDCDRQTIYSWERRGHLANPRRDEYGRRIYTQQQISDAYRTTRANAQRVRQTA